MGEKANHGERGAPTNHRRRLVLSQLQLHGSMTVRDLAEQIAVTDQGRCLESLCEEAIEEVEMGLHHVHVPKLEQAGFVDYDARNRIAGPTERGRRTPVDISCESASADRDGRITVSLCGETVDRLHEIIRSDDRFDGRMSYDEVLGTILADVTRAEADEAGDVGESEEARG